MISWSAEGAEASFNRKTVLDVLIILFEHRCESFILQVASIRP